MTALLLNIRQAVDATATSDYTIRKAINEGKLVAKKVGNAIRIRPIDLEAWVDSLEDVSK